MTSSSAHRLGFERISCNQQHFYTPMPTERSLAAKKPLYVVFIDLKTAFDLTDRHLLWALLRKYGVEGCLLDILRKLYRDPGTAPRVNGRFSVFYKVPLGVLQGDPISPLLFIIFMSALCMTDTDDPTLSEMAVPELMLADDVILVSSTLDGMQRKLLNLETFCKRWRLILHIKDKTKAMTLGKSTPSDLAPLTLCGQPVQLTTNHPFNGFTVSWTKGDWDSRPHLLSKIQKARRTANCILALRKRNLSATPQQMILLWQTCVEPHLTYCSEVTFDAHKFVHKAMAQLQTDYFRCCLGLHMRSVKEVVYTDIAILPIKERLLYLSTKFYNYAIGNPTHYAHLALKDSIALAPKTKHSWYCSFSSNMNQYGIIIPADLMPFDLKALTSRLETTVLNGVLAHTATMSRMEIHQLTPMTWRRKLYTTLEISLAAAIASLRSSTHFLNIERLRCITASRRVARCARTCSTCTEKVED